MEGFKITCQRSASSSHLPRGKGHTRANPISQISRAGKKDQAEEMTSYKQAVVGIFFKPPSFLTLLPKLNIVCNILIAKTLLKNIHSANTVRNQGPIM